MSRRRSGVGICAAIERVALGRLGRDGDDGAALLRARGAGGRRRCALLLPPDDAAPRARRTRLLDRIDALILAGGADVDPAAYGAEPHPETTGTWPERDDFELALTRRALERGHAGARRSAAACRC